MTTAIVKIKPKRRHELHVGVYVRFFFFYSDRIWFIRTWHNRKKNYNCNPGIKCSVFFAMVANVVPVMTQTRKHGIVKSNPRVHRLDKEGL